MSELTYNQEATIVLPNDEVLVEFSASQLSYKLSNLTNDKERYYDSSRRYELAIDKAREYLTDNYEELSDHADALAELLGVELVREVEVNVQINLDLTIQVKPNEDIEDLIREHLSLNVEVSGVDDFIIDYTTEIADINEY